MARLCDLFALSFLMLPLAPASAGQEDAHAGKDAGLLVSGSLVETTYLVELRQGSSLSALASSLGNGGFETSGGSRVDFRPWYSSRWTDASIGWMTQVTPNFGLLYGFSTGERGPKYEIAPALKLGFVMQAQTGRNAFVSLRASTTVGGTLKEKPCSADYGQIGGVQTVNCRLAASLLPPEQTLGYLVREKPPDRHQLNLVFTWRF